MDLVLDVISNTLLHWGEISAFPFLKGSCSWAIMFIPISPGIMLRCLASWLAGLFTTKIPLHGIMTLEASTSSSRYPVYGIGSPFAAINLNQSPVGKTGFPWGQKWSLKNSSVIGDTSDPESIRQGTSTLLNCTVTTGHFLTAFSNTVDISIFEPLLSPPVTWLLLTGAVSLVSCQGAVYLVVGLSWQLGCP